MFIVKLSVIVVVYVATSSVSKDECISLKITVIMNICTELYNNSIKNTVAQSTDAARLCMYIIIDMRWFVSMPQSIPQTGLARDTVFAMSVRLCVRACGATAKTFADR